MTIPRLKAMNSYWKLHPPVHVMVANYLGVSEKVEKEVQKAPEITQEEKDRQTAEALLAMFPMRR